MSRPQRRAVDNTTQRCVKVPAYSPSLGSYPSLPKKGFSIGQATRHSGPLHSVVAAVYCKIPFPCQLDFIRPVGRISRRRNPTPWLEYPACCSADRPLSDYAPLIRPTGSRNSYPQAETTAVFLWIPASAGMTEERHSRRRPQVGELVAAC